MAGQVSTPRRPGQGDTGDERGFHPPPPTPTSCPHRRAWQGSGYPYTHTKSQSLRLSPAMRPLGQPLPQAKLDAQGPLARRGRSRRGPRTLDSTQGLLGGRRQRAEPGHPPGSGVGGCWPRGTRVGATASPLPHAVAGTASRGQRESRAQAILQLHPPPALGTETPTPASQGFPHGPESPERTNPASPSFREPSR